MKLTALTALPEFSLPLGTPHILVFIWMLIKTICFYSIADRDHHSWERYTRITRVLWWSKERCHCKNSTDRGQRKRWKSIKISSNSLRTLFYWMYFHKIAHNRLLACEFYLVHKKARKAEGLMDQLTHGWIVFCFYLVKSTSTKNLRFFTGASFWVIVSFHRCFSYIRMPQGEKKQNKTNTIPV